MKKFLFSMLSIMIVITFTNCHGNVTKLDKSSGCLNGSFSVAEGKQVRFSQGNLQYTQNTDTWSFAKNQYDMIGTNNVTEGSVKQGGCKYGTALADKIDLFGWSGSRGVAQWGISTSPYPAAYSGDFKDWGNNIGDGKTWRTLTDDEWDYLINDRTNADHLNGVACINLNATGSVYVNGLILLPDNWEAPAGITFKSGFADYGAYNEDGEAYANYQTFTLDQWHKLEKSGAVFLPAAGTRYGTFVKAIGFCGYYWSATPDDEDRDRADDLSFSSSGASCMFVDCRYFGCAVRLVQDL